MASSAMNKIRQIVRLKQVMQRWRQSSSSSSSSGHVPMEVGPERTRFSVPARFVNQPILMSLLNEARDEFGGYQPNGVLSLPACDPDLFRVVIEFLEIDEDKYGQLGVEEFAEFKAAEGKEEEDVDDEGFVGSGRVGSSQAKPLLQNA